MEGSTLQTTRLIRSTIQENSSSRVDWTWVTLANSASRAGGGQGVLQQGPYQHRHRALVQESAEDLAQLQQDRLPRLVLVSPYKRSSYTITSPTVKGLGQLGGPRREWGQAGQEAQHANANPQGTCLRCPGATRGVGRCGPPSQAEALPLGVRVRVLLLLPRP
jgi:hypothetical protein